MSTLRLLPAPVREPRPLDRVPLREPVVAPMQGTLALAMPDGEELPPAVEQPAVLPRGIPEPQVWAAAFAQAAVEVAAGTRAAAQLVRWTTPELQAMLARRRALSLRLNAQRPMPKPRVRSVVAGHPRPGVCEVAVVVAQEARVRAVAFRMEAVGDRWRVTALEFG